jgi:hypothetical protein
MSTASFAWFAMNTQVTATGMEVKAKADSIFLEISGKQDVDAQSEIVWGTTGTDMKANGEGKITPVELYPVAHNAFENAAAVAVAENWFYKYAKDPNSSASTGNATPLGSLENYVYQTEFKVRLNPNMVKEAENLRVTSVNLPENTGITLVLVCGNTVLEDFEADYTASGEDAGKVLLADMGEDVVTIKAYIYIDGDNTNVFTNNVDADGATKLFGAVSFTLGVSAKSAQQ